MPVDMALLASFVVAVLVGSIVPGPATALVLRQSALYGTAATIPVIVGMDLGLYGWVVITAFGMGALVTASEIGYLVLRIVGAGVLIVLGVQAWRASRHADAPQDAGPAPQLPGRLRGTVTGLVTNLANPKMAVFFFAFYPQFVGADAPVLTLTLLLGVVHVLVDATWYLTVAGVVGKGRALFVRSSTRRWMERGTGTVLIGLGLRLAAAGR